MKRTIVKCLTLLSFAVALSGCKLDLMVSSGGDVQSLSGTRNCAGGNVCEFEVTDASFSETFTAVPRPGYVFTKWLGGAGFLCGESTDPTCTASNAALLDLVGEESVVASILLASGLITYAIPVFDFVGIDTDDDGTPDFLDEDDDNDGILDVDDPCPLDPNPDCGSNEVNCGEGFESVADGYKFESPYFTEYYYALSAEPSDFGFDLIGDTCTLRFGGGAVGSGRQFSVVTDNGDVVFTGSDLAPAEGYWDAVGINAAWQASGDDGLLTMYTTTFVGIAFIMEGMLRPTRISLAPDAGLDMSIVYQTASVLTIEPPVSGTGNFGVEGKCQIFDLGGLTSAGPWEVGLYPDTALEIQDGPDQLFTRYTGYEFLVCDSIQAGEYPVRFTGLDGKGGSKEFPLLIRVLSTPVAGGGITWSNE